MQQNPPLEHMRGQQQRGAGLQENTEDVQRPPNVTAPYMGWYPRWWLLAAFFCSVVVGLGAILWHPVICRNDIPLLCSIVDRFSFFMIIPIWLFFLGLWYGILVSSVGPVEFPRRGGSRSGAFVRNISQFRSRRLFILLQGTLAFILINVLWWLNQTTPLAFAMLTIVVFVSHCCFFQELDVNQRRLSFIFYAATALMLLVLETTLRPNFFNHWPSADEWPLLLAELFLIIVGIIALIAFLRHRPAAAPTAIDAQNQNINDATSWWVVVRSVWPLSRLFPNRPVTAADQQAQNQPDPQAQQNNRR